MQLNDVVYRRDNKEIIGFVSNIVNEKLVEVYDMKHNEAKRWDVNLIAKLQTKVKVSTTLNNNNFMEILEIDHNQKRIMLNDGYWYSLCHIKSIVENNINPLYCHCYNSNIVDRGFNNIVYKYCLNCKKEKLC